MTNDEEIQIINFYKDGLTMSIIGDKMEYSSMTIRKALINNNIPIKEIGLIRLDKSIIFKVLELRLEGLTQKEIANKLNISEITIRKYLKEYGVKKKYLIYLVISLNLHLEENF